MENICQEKANQNTLILISGKGNIKTKKIFLRYSDYHIMINGSYIMILSLYIPNNMPWKYINRLWHLPLRKKGDKSTVVL